MRIRTYLYKSQYPHARAFEIVIKLLFPHRVETRPKSYTLVKVNQKRLTCKSSCCQSEPHRHHGTGLTDTWRRRDNMKT